MRESFTKKRQSWLIYSETLTINLASKFTPETLQKRKSNHKTGTICQKWQIALLILLLEFQRFINTKTL